MAGPSMLPTLDNSGELVLESILPHRLFPNQLGRGELITLTSPVDPSRIICKRVIGLPGDVVCVDPTGLKAHSTEHVLVPKGHIWVAGDNAAWSKDSRDYGPVSIALVRGRIAARVSAQISHATDSMTARLALHRFTRSTGSPSSLRTQLTSNIDTRDNSLE